MYAVKDNRIPIIERMMELGCDLITVNKVRTVIHLPIVCSSFLILFFTDGFSLACRSWSTNDLTSTGDDFSSIYRSNNWKIPPKPTKKRDSTI